MKKNITVILAVVLSLMGCSSKVDTESKESTAPEPTLEPAEKTAEPEITEETEPVQENTDFVKDYSIQKEAEDFYTVNDPELLKYYEETVYDGLVSDLNDSEYLVQNVRAVYVSKEYLDELEYNSKENVYFGYTLSELDKEFSGKRYIFTLGDNGETVVKEFEQLNDDTFARVAKNVAVGSGVILVCVTVSVATAGTAPAVSMIFAVSAKTGAAMALSAGAMSGIAAGAVTGITTGDLEEALKEAALKGSESFKWGAIAGAVSGGVGEATGLYGATLNGLSMDDAAIIQRESKWPLEFIKNMHSVDEYKVYVNAGLQPVQIGERWALIQSVDWDFVDENGFTNLERVLERGLSPIGPDGKPFELHHVGQKADAPLAILTHTQHHAAVDYGIIHYAEEGKDITESAWAAERSAFWERLANQYIKVTGI